VSSEAAQGLIDRILARIQFLRAPSKPTTKEVANLKTIPPSVQRWQLAILRRDAARAIQAGEGYEAAWQAVGTYVNYRSLPLYMDIEPDTQFVIDEGMRQPQPD
jgi:hypothetical protein